MKTSEINITVLEPNENMTLTNGQFYSKKVFLGNLDEANNWFEIPDEEVPDDYKEVENNGS